VVGSIGIIDLILNYPTTLNPPNDLMKQINGMIDQGDVKKCKTVYDYLFLIETKNAAIYEQYEKIKLDSQLFSSASCKTVAEILATGKVTKPVYSPATHNHNNINNTNNTNNNNLNNYNPNSKNNNDFDDNDSKNSDCFDVDETNNRNDFFEGDNPGNNVTNNLNSIHRNLPCYQELDNKCTAGRTCRYSHDPELLHKTYLERVETMSACKYKHSPGAYSFHNPPQILKGGTPLRALKSLENEGQVSANIVDISNHNNNVNDNRLTYIKFSDMPLEEKQGGQDGYKTI
jgi:hypothetical protein